MKTNQAVTKELKRIAAAHGGELQPKTVVDAARFKTSVLHHYFDWNDSSAAEKYRLWQARMLIRVLVSYVETSDGERVPCRVFVSLTPDREDDSGYRITTAVLSDPAQRQQLLADAKAEMKRFMLKYRRLTELAEVFTAMQKVA
jgi:hypothetical protein